MTFGFITSLTYDSSSSNSATVSGWSSITDGDIGFALVSRGYDDETPTGEPSGWTKIAEISRTTYYPYYIGLYYRIHQNGDSDPTWSFTAADRLAVKIGIYRSGFYPVYPIYAYSNDQYVTSDTTVRSGGTPAVEDGPVLHIGGVTYGTSVTFTPPSGFAEDIDQGSTASHLHSVFASKVWPSDTSDTGVLDSTCSVTTTNKHAFTVAMNPDLNWLTTEASIGSPVVTAELRNGNRSTAASLLGDLTVAATFAQVNTLAVEASIGSPVVAVSFDQANALTIAASVGSPVAAAVLNNGNTLVAAPTVGDVIAAVSFDQVNGVVASVSVGSPVVTAELRNGNRSTAASLLGDLTAAAAFTQVNPLSVEASIGSPVAAAAFTQLNTLAVEASIGSPVVAATFAQVNPLSVEASIGSPVAAATFSQLNTLAVEASIGSPVAAAVLRNGNRLATTPTVGSPAAAMVFAQVNTLAVEASLGSPAVTITLANLAPLHSGSILRYFPMGPAILRTYGPSVNADGEMSAGNTAERPIRLRPLQPAVGKELLWLPEGDRARAHMFTWTMDRVAIHDEGDPGDADRIIKDGKVYVVAKALDWERDGHLELLIRLLPGEVP